MLSGKKIAGICLLSIVLIAVIVTAGCISGEQTGPADTIFLGNVITMDDNNPIAEAVAVKDGIILFVGSTKDAKAFCDENTDIIDYGDNSIYPGFLEAHAHVGLAGLRGFGMTKLSDDATLKETVEEIQTYIKENPDKKYYMGFGWYYTGGEEPTAAMLDTVCSNVPVILQSGDTHSVWVNSKALEVINYTPEEIKAFGPAQVHVDADGKPTGYISEIPAFEIFNMFSTLAFSTDELKEFTLKWQEEAISNGFTAYCDAGIELFGERQYEVYNTLSEDGKLKIRIYGLTLVGDNTDTPEEDMAKIAATAEKYDSEYFKIIGAKVFLDGVIEAHTGWLLDAYKDQPEYYGLPRFSDTDRMARLITAADKYGMFVHAHCIGDAAAKMFADSVEKSVAETGNYDQRNAAAHLQLITKDDIERFGKLGIIAVSGYRWSPKDSIYPMEIMYTGKEKADSSYPVKSFMNAGSILAGHTDYPIETYESVPLTVYTGVARLNPLVDADATVAPRGAEEVLTREEALKSLTTNVAYMWHEEDRMGSLEEGKLANMAIFDIDMLHDDLEDFIPSLLSGTVATIIDGQVVYTAAAETT